MRISDIVPQIISGKFRLPLSMSKSNCSQGEDVGHKEGVCFILTW